VNRSSDILHSRPSICRHPTQLPAAACCRAPAKPWRPGSRNPVAGGCTWHVKSCERPLWSIRWIRQEFGESHRCHRRLWTNVQISNNAHNCANSIAGPDGGWGLEDGRALTPALSQRRGSGLSVGERTIRRLISPSPFGEGSGEASVSETSSEKSRHERRWLALTPRFTPPSGTS